VKRKLCLVMAIIMSMALLAGCDGTSAGTKLGKAVVASYDIKSAETVFDAKMKISATGLSDEDKASFDQVMTSMGNMSVSGKLIQTISDDRLKTKASGTMEVSAGGFAFKNINLWVDSDFTGENKKFVEVIQFPPAIGAMDAKLKGKDFIVMDLDKMMPSNMPNQTDILKNSMKMNEDAKKLFTAMMTDFKPGFDFVSEAGTITLPDGLRATNYRVTLDDAKFKKLLRAQVNYLSTSPVFDSIMKSYMETLSTSIGTKLEGKAAVVDPTMSSGQETFKTEANKALDQLEKYRILGANGIVIDFTVDEKGNIRKENIKTDISIDLKQVSEGKSQGVLNIAVDMNVDINRINEAMEITMPELTAANSISFADLVKQPLRYFPGSTDKKVINKANYYKIKSVMSEVNGVAYSIKKDIASFVVDGKTYKLKLDSNYIMENGKKIKVSGVVLKKVKNTVYISGKALKAMKIILVNY